MMKLKVIPIGNSEGVILPQELLSKLKLSPGDTLYASETENEIALTAHDPEFEAQMELAEEIMSRNVVLLRKLAKS